MGLVSLHVHEPMLTAFVEGPLYKWDVKNNSRGSHIICLLGLWFNEHNIEGEEKKTRNDINGSKIKILQISFIWISKSIWLEGINKIYPI